MPELPEVEVVKQGLQLFVGDRLQQVIFVPNKVVKSNLNRLVGKEIEQVTRRGRYLKITFTDQIVLVVHLGMTGNLQTRSEASPFALEKHEFFRFRFRSNRQLSFFDYRHFGKVFFHHENLVWEKKLGVEPLSNELTANYWFEKARNKHLPLKLFLMDNKVVTGIGNIYANEILFATRQHPERPAWTVSLMEWQLLVEQTKTILELAIKQGGTSVKDYLNVQGERGSFQNFLKVYARKGKPCLVCGNKLTVIKQGGRSSFFCANCQQY